MLVFLPEGLLGLVVASLAAAYMSTISTHLNWGASYVVDDVYRRFLVPGRDESHYVRAARVSTLLLVMLASVVALWLENALQAFQILLQIGAGTGMVFLLRWYWWRINAWSELAAMVVSFLVAVYFQFGHEPLGFPPLAAHVELVTGVAVTTVGWLVVTFTTRPASPETLQRFYESIRPMGPGWRGSGIREMPDRELGGLSAAVLAWFLGCAVIYGALFGTGFALYGQPTAAAACLTLAAVSAVALMRTLPRVGIR
jgi:Na+(H+)/acetate symporter ActP